MALALSRNNFHSLGVCKPLQHMNTFTDVGESGCMQDKKRTGELRFKENLQESTLKDAVTKISQKCF